MSVKRRRDSPDRYADEDLEVRRSIIQPIHMIFHDFRPCACSPRPDVGLAGRGHDIAPHEDKGEGGCPRCQQQQEEERRAFHIH